MIKKFRDAIARFLLKKYLLSEDGQKVMRECLCKSDEFSILKKRVRHLSSMTDDDIRYIADRLPPEGFMSVSSFFPKGKNWFVGPMPLMRGAQYVHIGENFDAGRAFRLEAIGEHVGQKFTPNITIGDNVGVGDFVHIGCIDSIEIGDGTIIGSKSFITDHFHGSITAEDLNKRPFQRPLSHKPVKIGKNVWVGDGVCIFPGVTLGDNVIVGANAVVTHSFEDNSIIAGCPAKLIRKL